MRRVIAPIVVMSVLLALPSVRGATPVDPSTHHSENTTYSVGRAGDQNRHPDNSQMPYGTFAVGYGTSGKLMVDTPFTVLGNGGGGIGIQAAIPEPASIALLGTGLLLAAMRLRKRRQGAPANSPSVTTGQ